MTFYRSNRQMVGHLVNGFVFFAELLLLLRVVLKFFVAEANSSFVHWAFTTTNTLLEPFRGVFTNPTHTQGSWYVDYVALFAMAVYAAAGYILISLAARSTPMMMDTTSTRRK